MRNKVRKGGNVARIRREGYSLHRWSPGALSSESPTRTGVPSFSYPELFPLHTVHMTRARRLPLPFELSPNILYNPHHRIDPSHFPLHKRVPRIFRLSPFLASLRPAGALAGPKTYRAPPPFDASCPRRSHASGGPSSSIALPSGSPSAPPPPARHNVQRDRGGG